jgi:DNA-directed RNA polymerase subunit RPC12/RpoP
MAIHHCSKCSHAFEVERNERVANKLSYLLYPFHGPNTTIDKLSYVKCPKCGHEERDESIRFFRYFKPRTALVAILVLFLLIAVIDAMVR